MVVCGLITRFHKGCAGYIIFFHFLQVQNRRCGIQNMDASSGFRFQILKLRPVDQFLSAQFRFLHSSVCLNRRPFQHNALLPEQGTVQPQLRAGLFVGVPVFQAHLLFTFQTDRHCKLIDIKNRIPDRSCQERQYNDTNQQASTQPPAASRG